MLVDNGMRVLWLARTGWMQSGVPHCLAETVAQHTFIASLIALDLFQKIRASGKNFDEDRVLKMILVHDLAEGVSGDLPKWTKDLMEREELEEEAISRMGLPEEISEILRDYLTMGTYEARIARLADIMATWRIAIYYKQLGYEVDDILKSSQKESMELAKKLGIILEEDD